MCRRGLIVIYGKYNYFLPDGLCNVYCLLHAILIVVTVDYTIVIMIIILSIYIVTNPDISGTFQFY